MNNERKPDGVVFYSLTLRNASMLPDAELGQVLKAVWKFYNDGALPEGLNTAQSIVFDMFRQNVVDAVEKYKETCERNQRNANKRKSRNDSQPTVTTCDDPLPLAPNMNTNRTEIEFETETEYENEIDREHLPETESKNEPEWKARQTAWINDFEGRKQQ